MKLLYATKPGGYMINQEEIVKKNWPELRGEVQKNWSKLTHDDIEKTKGSVSALSSLVQQKHGVSSDQFDKKFSDIVKRFDSGSDRDKGRDTMSQEGQAGRSVEPRESKENRINN